MVVGFLCEFSVIELLYQSCIFIFYVATLLQMSLEVIQHPPVTALQGIQYPLADDQRALTPIKKYLLVAKVFSIL